jgi:L-ribulose-5-phosphate 3-epimerase
MLVAINAWTFPAGMDAEGLAGAAAQAGFEAVELTIGTDGPLTTQTRQEQCAEIARVFRQFGLKITSLATGLFWQCHYGHGDPAVRQQAKELTRVGLDMATWLGADALLVVPAVVGRWNDPVPQVAYADALARSIDALANVSGEAEDRGVYIAIENVWNRFLLSPMEMCELIDKVNSPWVGACFDIGNAMVFGYPQDWIRTLGRRIIRVHAKDYDLNRPGAAGFDCPLLEGSVDWAAVMKALRDIRYEGPLTYEGRGEPTGIARRLKQLLLLGSAS